MLNWKKIILGNYTFKRLIRSALVIYVLFTAMAFFFAEKLIFPYHQTSYDKNISHLSFLKTSDGLKIAIRHWKVINEKTLIIYFHGNYMDIGHLDEIVELLNTKKHSVLAMDYRGYGLSEGSVKESNAYSDAQMVYDYALAIGYKPENIIILGRSVGSGIATELARQNKSKALFLISPFSSTYRVITKYPFVLLDKFNNLAKIDEVDETLFIVHGTADKVIPAWHSKDLFDEHQAKHKRLLIKGAGHNDIWDDEYNGFIDQFDSFLNEQ